MEILDTYKEAFSNIGKIIKDSYMLIIAGFAGGSIGSLLSKFYDTDSFDIWNFTLVFIGMGIMFFILILLLFLMEAFAIAYRKNKKRKERK